MDTPLLSRRRIIRVYVLALLLTLLLFYLYVVVIFDVTGVFLQHKPWLLTRLDHRNTGKILILGCFFTLMLAHMFQALVWGLFLRYVRLLPTVSEAVYFSASSITTLGYGDILLKYPWRHIGTLIAISGVLMFGCSTAFLFLVLQDVWQKP